MTIWKNCYLEAFYYDAAADSYELRDLLLDGSELTVP